MAYPSIPTCAPTPLIVAPAVDMNQLSELVVVGTNGSLHLRGLFLDDCLLPAMPLVCLAAGTGGGSLLLDSLVRRSCAPACCLLLCVQWLAEGRSSPRNAAAWTAQAAESCLG